MHMRICSIIISKKKINKQTGMADVLRIKFKAVTVIHFNSHCHACQQHRMLAREDGSK